MQLMRGRSLTSVVAVSVFIVLLSPPLLHAANSLGLGAPEQAIKPEGFFASFLMWIQQQQQGFYKLMTGELQAMRQDGTHVFMLMALSFAYGVFHAAGPGHGKAVISSYMLANEVAARRGIILAFASAFLQAFVAIAVIAVLSWVLRGVGIKMADATQWLEIASFAGVTLLGAWLLWSKITGRGHSHGHGHAHSDAGPALHGHGVAHDHHHHHHHEHGHEHADGHDHGHAHGHGHDHAHVHSATCSHSISDPHGHGGTHDHLHAPDPRMLARKDFRLRQAWSAILAVGIRPCSGALIVLTFAFLNGLYLAGIASTFAMAVGTGLTVAMLAALAVWAKDAAIRIGGAAERGAVIHRVVEIGGAAMVFLFGITLFLAAISSGALPS